jgi:hypothetical protein
MSITKKEWDSMTDEQRWLLVSQALSDAKYYRDQLSKKNRSR